MSLEAARALALDFAERIQEQRTPLGAVTVQRFFSGAGLTAGGVLFGFVIRGTLYLRADEKSRPGFEARGSAPFRYSGRTKTVTVGAFYEAPSEVLDDDEALALWAIEAHRAASAAKKPRKTTKKKPRPKRARRHATG